ncbi:MAG: hypothetical protein ACKVZJ_10140 [Phycisphaerales bacterium]
MSHHRCNCCEGGECVQPGPCCEPDFTGRCTPVGWNKNPDGTWSGPPNTALMGRAGCTGNITKKLQKLTNGLPDGANSALSMPFAADQFEPVNQITLSVSPGDCPRFSGGHGASWFRTVPLDPPWLGVACGPIVPQLNMYGQEFRVFMDYDPGAGIVTPPSNGTAALGRVIVDIASLDVTIRLEFRMFRAGQNVNAVAAGIMWSAKISVNNPSGGGLLTRDLRPDQVRILPETPCGTRVRVFIDKFPYDNPFPFLDEEEPARPAGIESGIDGPPASGCSVGVGLAVQLQVVVDLTGVDGERFVACQDCREAPSIPCVCNTPWIVRSLGGGRWEPPRVSVQASGTYTYPPPGPTPPPEYPVSETLTGVIEPDRVIQCSDEFVSACGARFDYYGFRAGGLVRYNTGRQEAGGVAFGVIVGSSAQSGVTVACFALSHWSENPTSSYVVWFADGGVGTISQTPPGAGACRYNFNPPNLPPPAGMTIQDNGPTKTVRYSQSGSVGGATFNFDWVLTITGLVRCRSSLPSGAVGGGGGAPDTSGGCSGCGGGSL